MDRQRLNRLTAIFLTVMVLVVALMLSGSLRHPAHIVLPQENESSGQLSNVPGADDGALTAVTISPDTVQTAIETLARPDLYRRSVSVQQFWGSGSGTLETTVTVLAPWTRLDRTLVDGRQRHTITNGEDTYIWYGSEETVLHTTASDITADMEQSIPTYEDVLALPVEEIAAADYRTISSHISCIYVETGENEAGYTLRYWISVDSGLLVAAEKLLGEETVYRMWETAIDLAPIIEGEFLLPDGTHLIA